MFYYLVQIPQRGKNHRTQLGHLHQPSEYAPFPTSLEEYIEIALELQDDLIWAKFEGEREIFQISGSSE